jgi:hypothetical protein
VSWALRFLVLLGLVVATPALVSCRGDDRRSDEPTLKPEQPVAATDPGLQHIHGLGVRGDTLYIATHTGLWIAPRGQTKAQRFGSSRQDIMGFSVVSSDRFIGSGHPDPSQNLPPNLGLIESRDAGRTWKNVSLLGEADFHVLESAGSRIYGFNGVQARLMVSVDGGRRWAQRTPPGAMFSLAIDPRSSQKIVVATERGISSSPDGGRNWQSLSGQLAGLLAWPAANRLFLVDGSGQVSRSSDGGRNWRAVGSIQGQPAAFIAQGNALYAAIHDGTVKRSVDDGRSWSVRATP